MGHEIKAQITPFSSVVGQSVLLIGDDGAALAQLSISVPDPSKPYRETAEEIARIVERAINEPPAEEVKRLRVRLADLMLEDAKRMAALAKLAPAVEAVREAAQAVLDSRCSTYTARNGRKMGIQDDSGEMMWIVPFDEMHALEAALAPAAQAGTVAQEERE